MVAGIYTMRSICDESVPAALVWILATCALQAGRYLGSSMHYTCGHLPIYVNLEKGIDFMTGDFRKKDAVASAVPINLIFS